jgi:hypothetical protein
MLRFMWDREHRNEDAPGGHVERYGLFKKLADGSPLWVGAANDLTEAKAKMQVLADKTGLEHSIHDFRSNMLVATSRGEPSAGSNP